MVLKWESLGMDDAGVIRGRRRMVVLATRVYFGCLVV